jgi:hypothetical protein
LPSSLPRWPASCQQFTPTQPFCPARSFPYVSYPFCISAIRQGWPCCMRDIMSHNNEPATNSGSRSLQFFPKPSRQGSAPVFGGPRRFSVGLSMIEGRCLSDVVSVKQSRDLVVPPSGSTSLILLARFNRHPYGSVSDMPSIIAIPMRKAKPGPQYAVVSIANLHTRGQHA